MEIFSEPDSQPDWNRGSAASAPNQVAAPPSNESKTPDSSQSARTPEAFLTYLVQRGKIGVDSLNRIQSIGTTTGEPVPTILTQLGFVAEDEIAHALADFLTLPLADGLLTQIIPLGDGFLNAQFLKHNKVLPLRITEDSADIGFVDPLNPALVEALQFALNRQIAPHVLRERDFDTLFAKHYSSELTSDMGQDESGDPIGIDDLERLQDSTSTAPIIRLVSSTIAQAVEAGASDVHIEPSEDFLRIRYRIDGVLIEIARHPTGIAPSVISRIKVLARLNISERRLPQDGRTKLAVRGRHVDLRVSTTPTMHGESVVLRILDRSAVRLDLPSLGFSAVELSRFRSIMTRPHGILLVTGPTGSGKTTTLYASLLELNSEQRKLLTVEDPIEYQLSGINQVQIQPAIGLTFAHALRSFLRQDPDIMMVGEIRDLETAQIAVQAALTGHLILSTLHTNDAASAITRLLDMGVENYLLASTINGIVGQRLVRSLCPLCKKSYRPDPDTLHQYGFSDNTQVLYCAQGCSACHSTGYRGRRAIAEVLAVTDAIHQLIVSRADASDIRRAAISEGMQSMFATGRSLVLAGETTLDELLRVIRDD